MNRLMFALIVAFVINTGVIVWAHTVELFYFSGFNSVLALFWGRVVLFDFVASLLLVGFWITLLHPPEQRLIRGVLWTLTVVVLGTPVALLFFILRARQYTTTAEVFLGQTKG